jgi:hypothetical protein
MKLLLEKEKIPIGSSLVDLFFKSIEWHFSDLQRIDFE